MLLKFSRRRHDVFCIVTCVGVKCKGLFFIRQHSKEQGQALGFDPSQHCFGFMLHLRMYSYNFYSISLN